jgi:hypothetical protein
MPAIANLSPWRRVYPGQYDSAGVPHPLRRAVQVLNEALAIDKANVSALLETFRVVEGDAVAKFSAHPTIVLGGDDPEVTHLSVLGLMQGFVLTERFRLCGWLDDDKTYTEFFVFEDTRVPAPPSIDPVDNRLVIENGALIKLLLDTWKEQEAAILAEYVQEEDGIFSIDLQKVAARR